MTQPRRKPRLFIGSSSEALQVASAMQELLGDSAEVTIWNQAVFELSATVIEGLVEAIELFDCAAFVFSPSDVATIREQQFAVVRDNVLFELGLFSGRLGRDRCFIVQPEGEPLRLPTDLLGIVVAKYDSHRSDENLVAALGPACNRIRRQLPANPSVRIPALGLALQRISQAADTHFADLATRLISAQAEDIADGRVEYVIAQNPDCLRTSIATALDHVRATYFIERSSDAAYLLSRKMLSWLEYNSTIARSSDRSFARLFVLREAPTRVRRYWNTIQEICQHNAAAGIRVRLLNGSALFDQTLPNTDRVIVDNVRMHIHAAKIGSDVPYTTATMCVDALAIRDALLQWDRMWADAFEWPIDLDAFSSERNRFGIGSPE